MATKYCKNCDTTKPLIEFYKNPKGGIQGVFNECIKCHRKRSFEYKCANRYGITTEYYQECMATSEGCEICGTKDNLVYDHCHDSMAFRGVLCNSHNLAIGGLGDTKEGILNALRYLETHEEKCNEGN